jgi:DNA-binding response OmpR family regulator
MDRIDNNLPLSTPPNGPGSRLLVVDDEPEIRSGLTRVLSLEGYLADEAASGHEALQMLNHTAYDLMLLDLQLPELSGLQVLQQSRQIWPDLLIIILTGHATLESAITAAKSDEVADYLLKPVRNEEILAAVHRALTKQLERASQQRLIKAAREILNVVSQPQPETNHVISPQPPIEPEAAATDPEQVLNVSPFNLDRKERLVTLDSDPTHPIELAKGEVAVLSSLMSYPNHVLSCRRIVYLSWGDAIDESEAESIIRPYISRLRQKLETDPRNPQFILTVRRRGYRFTPQ